MVRAPIAFCGTHDNFGRMRIATIILTLLSFSCGEKDAGLCDRYFEPYGDIISGRRAVMQKDNTYVNAMRLYSEGRFDLAADSLGTYIQHRGYEKSAHLYLAMCLLVMDLPYDAELQLDHLENSRLKDFRDQTEWYTLLCWVCSDQLDRAIVEAARIAGAKHHTYKMEAQRLAADLERIAGK